MTTRSSKLVPKSPGELERFYLDAITREGSSLEDIATRNHSMLQLIGELDPTSADTVKDKHLSNAQGKVWQDHTLITDANPHGTNHSQLDVVEPSDDTSASTDGGKHVSDAQVKAYKDHTLNTSNPHSTTYAQVGADPAGAAAAVVDTTSVTGVLKGNGSVISAAVANTDYVPSVSPDGLTYLFIEDAAVTFQANGPGNFVSNTAIAFQGGATVFGLDALFGASLSDETGTNTLTLTAAGLDVTAPYQRCTGVIGTGGYTVATLPAGTIGDRAYVTNALAPAFGAAVVGGGAVTIPVFYNGAAWIVC